MPTDTNHQQSELIDESSEESFPASDAPAWSVIVKPHKNINQDNNVEEKTFLEWKLSTTNFNYETYNRDAIINFSGGDSITLSNPEIYGGDNRFINSEALLVASLSFCYMQTFLAIASKNHYIVQHYTDHAIGKLGKNAQGRMCIVEIKLHPRVAFAQNISINSEKLQKLQESAHRNCFIANSVSSNVIITTEFM